MSGAAAHALILAADHLEALDRAATTAQDGWLGYSDCPAEQPRGQIFAGPMDEHGYRTGSVCSWSEDDENSHVMSQADMDLICTLRSVAAPLAQWLRTLAARYDALGVGNARSEALRAAGEQMIDGLPQALDVAHAILGVAR